MEFEPIYPAGFHDISVDTMHDIFVTPFQDNERRKYLTDRFKDFLDKFSELGIGAEIWIDGSYSTNKPEPGDIDIVFFCNPTHLNALSPDKHILISELFNRDLSKIRYNCEVFLVPTDNFNLRSYWRGWFAFSRDEKPKGIPRINYAVI
jgi:hypothetical protein